MNRWPSWLPIVLLLAAGCATPAVLETPAQTSLPIIRQTSANVEPADPFAGQAVLPLDRLLEQILARNPSLEQMQAAWQAAQARYPQATAWDDPMTSLWTGPGTFGSNQHDLAYRAEVSQKLLWPGKRELKGQNARAEAEAAGHEVEDLRRQLLESGKLAYFDYYQVAQALAINREGLRLLEEFRQNALTRYKLGQTPQQDALQAEVELGRQRERQLELEQVDRVARARLNTLLHREPDEPLPPAPRALPARAPLAEPAVLRQQALARRADLQALRERLRAEEAQLGLAWKEKCPDLELMGAFDNFWQGDDRPLRPQVGVKLNLPVQQGKRQGMILEAQAKLAQRRAEYAKLSDQVRFQVEEAYSQARKSDQTVDLYEKIILPAAQDNVKAAQSAYITGKTPFVSLVEAQRNVVMLRERAIDALASAHKSRAMLERVAGSSEH